MKPPTLEEARAEVEAIREAQYEALRPALNAAIAQVFAEIAAGTNVEYDPESRRPGKGPDATARERRKPLPGQLPLFT